MGSFSQGVRIAAWQNTFALLERMRSRHDGPEHLRTGRRGEEAAFFYLRGLGLTVIAQGWQSGKAPGDLDLVAWESGMLCFIEVKTRSSRVIATAEAAVDRAKRRSLRRLARHYMRQMPPETQARFDILSIYLHPGKAVRQGEFELYRNAFGWVETEHLPL